MLFLLYMYLPHMLCYKDFNVLVSIEVALEESIISFSIKATETRYWMSIWHVSRKERQQVCLFHVSKRRMGKVQHAYSIHVDVSNRRMCMVQHVYSKGVWWSGMCKVQHTCWISSLHGKKRILFHILAFKITSLISPELLSMLCVYRTRTTRSWVW